MLRALSLCAAATSLSGPLLSIPDGPVWPREISRGNRSSGRPSRSDNASGKPAEASSALTLRQNLFERRLHRGWRDAKDFQTGQALRGGRVHFHKLAAHGKYLCRFQL